MKRVWQCDSCHLAHNERPWICPGCGKETCENCFDRLAHCKACSTGKSDEELKDAANKAGFDFD